MTGGLRYNEALEVALLGWILLAILTIIYYLLEVAGTRGRPSSFAPCDIPPCVRLIAPGTPTFLIAWCFFAVTTAMVRIILSSCPYRSEWWSGGGTVQDPDGTMAGFSLITYLAYTVCCVIDNLLLLLWVRCVFRDGSIERAWRIILVYIGFYLCSAIGWGGTSCVLDLGHASAAYALIIFYYVIHTLWVLLLAYTTGSIYARSSGLVVSIAPGDGIIDNLL
jgi:hypothetical protein